MTDKTPDKPSDDPAKPPVDVADALPEGQQRADKRAANEAGSKKK